MTHRADALRSLLFASSAAGMLLAAAPALAGDPDATTDPQQQDATNLGTVTVTGQPVRREPQSPEFVAPLVDTPRAVTIIPQQIIEQTAATSLQDILRTSPGSPSAPVKAASRWPTVRSSAASRRATTSSSTASATRAASSARSSTWSRSRS